ncbi:MAG: CYTH domain-containing protein [Candidatus Wallbacteria bacterium]
MPIEKERKFKLKKLPENIDTVKCDKIEQYYLMPDENEKQEGYESKRIRLKNGIKATLTLKSAGLKERREIEKEISINEYEKLKKEAKKHISKIRYLWHYNDFNVEIDIFNNIDLVMAEVESEAADNFKAPEDWIEVTNDKLYQNNNLARPINFHNNNGECNE